MSSYYFNVFTVALHMVSYVCIYEPDLTAIINANPISYASRLHTPPPPPMTKKKLKYVFIDLREELLSYGGIKKIVFPSIK